MKILTCLFVLTILCLAAVTFQFCVQPPDYPKEPVIEFVGLSRSIIPQGQGTDSLFATLTFTDGDGDLGYPTDNPTPSIFYRDSRDSFAKDSLQIPYIEPQGASNGISGEITVRLLNTCCIYSTPDGIKLACENVPNSFQYDTVYYFIKMRDRAGNISNEVKAGPIVLQCH